MLAKKKKEPSKLRIVWYFISKYKIFFLILMLMSIIVGALESLNVAIMYPIISEGLGTQITSNTFLNLIDPFVNIIPVEDPLVKYCIIFLIIAIISFLTKIIYYYLSVKFSAMVVQETKKEIFKKSINADYQFFVDHKQGELLYKTSFAPASISAILQIFTDLSVELFMSLSIFFVLLSMSWKLILVAIIGGIGYYYLTKYLSATISYKAGKKQRESGEKERVIVSEYTTGIKHIKVFETFKYWNDLFNKVLNTFYFHERRKYFWKKFPEILIWLVLYLSIGVAVIVIKIQYPGNFVNTLPVIGTFAFGTFMIIPKLSKFGMYRMKFMSVHPNVEAVYDVLKDKSYSKIVNGTKEFTGLQKGIILKNVTFSHKERDILLDDISFEIKKDQTTSLVGPSGSGKSTIVDLILRLYDVEKGGIYIDDKNIKEYDIFSFRRKIGFVGQETFIFNGTIKDNIAFGSEFTDKEIEEAAKMAQADEFIKKQPQGYNTIVGDRGLRLSGGEKQRLAIARAIIRKPEILILDEATSSLDNVSERIVQKAIDKVSERCTTFIIAHRLSTIQNADVIHVLDNGRIVESGTHEELLKKKGKYWGLQNIQD